MTPHDPTVPLSPPRVAELLVRLTCPAAEREAVLGDLSEEFQTIGRTEGAGPARRWYRRQARASVVPHLRRRLTWRHRPSAPQPERSPFMSSFVQDVRFGWRMLLRRPIVSIVALVSLVVGMSSATIVFSLLNAVAFRSLPVADADELRLVLEQRPTSVNHNFSYQDFQELGEHQRAFEALTAYTPVRAKLSRAGASEMVDGEIVAGSFFPMLGIRMRAGRGLTPADDRPGGPPVVVMSESFWRRLHGGDAVAALDNATVVLNEQRFTVVGVAAEPFRGMVIGRGAQFWAALHQQPVLDPSDGFNLLRRPGASWLTLLGRIRDRVSDAQATAELARVERALPISEQRPRTRTFLVEPGHQGDSALPVRAASPLQLLLAAAGLVLVVACANVAGLLLARAAERERELVLRTALGASRWRLTRLLFAEAALLGAVATAAAVGVSIVAARAAVPLLSRFGEPVILDVSLDWRVLAFSFAIALAATVLFGLVPVLATRRRALAPALADSSRGSAGRGRARLRRGLVATQFALSLALVFVALLLVRTLYNLRTLPTGFATDSVAVLAVTPEAAQFSLDRTTQYLADAEAALRAYPGVRAAGIAQVEPLDFGGSRMTVTIPGYDPPPDEDMELNYNRVSAAYFDAMGIAPLDGRAFTSTDAPGAPLAMIVNETMARRFWGDERAVGRAVLIGKTPTTVVGVVPDVKYRMLREAPRPSFYLSAAQSRPRFASFHVRSDGPPAALLDGLRRTLAAVDPAVPITRVRTLRDQAAINVNDERLAMTIAAALAGAAMLLAAVGLYGAMAFAVGQRAREIGIRMALGAVPADVRQLVLRQGIGLALAGSVAGVGLGLGFARAIEHRLFGVAATDALSILLAIFGLAGIAAVAAWVPARRAARVDPVRVLRT